MSEGSESEYVSLSSHSTQQSSAQKSLGRSSEASKKPKSAVSKYAGVSSSSSSSSSTSSDDESGIQNQKVSGMREDRETTKQNIQVTSSSESQAKSSDETERTSGKSTKKYTFQNRPKSAKPKPERSKYVQSSSSTNYSDEEDDSEEETDKDVEAKKHAKGFSKSEMKKFVAVSSSDESDETNSTPRKKRSQLQQSLHSSSHSNSQTAKPKNENECELEIPSHMKPFTKGPYYEHNESLSNFGVPLLAQRPKEHNSLNVQDSSELKQANTLSMSQTHIPLLSLQTSSSIDMDSKRDISIGVLSKVMEGSTSNESAKSQLHKHDSLDQIRPQNSSRGKTGVFRSIRSVNQSSSFPDSAEDHTGFKWNDTNELDLNDLEKLIPSQKIRETIQTNPSFDVKSVLWKSDDSSDKGKESLGAYYGTINKGKKHGWGIYRWADGREYRGEWVDDLMDGIGVYTWPRQPPKLHTIIKEAPGPVNMASVQCIYKGYFRKGHMEGIGHITDEKGTFYKGEWKASEISGEGVIQSKDKSEYRGALVNNKPHGKGTMKFADKSTYDGMWSDGFKEGNGNYIWNDGEIEYIGSFKKGKPEGRGTATWRLKAGKEKLLNQYNGEWKAGLRHGEGKYLWSDATMYSGEWVRGKMKPRGGELLFPDGTKK